MSDYLLAHFGEKISRVSVDAGVSCPHRGESRVGGGCIFCNNESFRPSYAEAHLPLDYQVAGGLRHFKKRRKFIIYFQAFSNTSAPVDRLRMLYGEALSIPGCVGLSIGTRPDCIDDEKLSLLEDLACRSFITVEYGLQSPYDQSLEWMKRGHDYRCFCDAVKKTAARNIHVATHIIMGLPGETEEMMLRTARMLSSLPLNFLKIHQLQVIRGTPLEQIYRESSFPLWKLDDYADFLCEFLEALRETIVIQRLYSLSHESLLIGPDWGKNKWDIERLIEDRLRDKGVQQGRKWSE